MATMEGYVICIALIIGVIVWPVVLHGYGMFGTEWITATSCEALNYKPACCNESKIYSTCYGSFGLRDLNIVVFIMQLIAWVVLIIHSVWVLIVIFCCGAAGDSCETYLRTIYFYLAAGLLSFIGCGIIVSEYMGQSFGKSFYFCLVSGMYVLIIGVVKCVQKVVKSKSQRDERNEAARIYGGHGCTEYNN